jgi:hypothetical protein
MAWSVLRLFFELVLRAALSDLRRRLVWVAVAVLAVALVSVGLVLSTWQASPGE